MNIFWDDLKTKVGRKDIFKLMAGTGDHARLVMIMVLEW
jgi:hypothetical protein